MKRIIFFIFPVLLLLFASCEDIIEVELNEEDTGLYAVEAIITTIDEPVVFLTKGLAVSANDDYQGISGAIVTITDNAVPANSIQLIQDPDKIGKYVVPPDIEYTGVTGRAYTVTILSDGVELVATDTLNPVSVIDSINIWPSLRGERRFLGIFTYGQEPAGLGNYYKWDIYINDTLLNEASTISLASDELVDGNYVAALEIFTDYHDPQKPSERVLKYGDNVFVKQISISKFAYEYFMQLVNQSMGGGMFSVPSANIKSNFRSSDGKEVLGLFSAHDVSVSNVVTIDDSIESQLND